MTGRDQHERTDREVIVTEGSGGTGTGMVLAAIIAVLGLLLAVWLFMNLGGTENGEGGGVVPDEIEIDVDPGTGGEGGEEGGTDDGAG